MTIRPIPDPFSGEKFADVYPRITPFVEQSPRLSRLNYFPGRHLTDVALGREQKVRTDRLQLRGRAVTSGVVEGLELTWHAAKGAVMFQLQPGHALTNGGIDLVVDRTVEFAYEDLRLFDLALNRVRDLPLGLDPAAPVDAHTAVLVLQPGFVDDADLPLAAQEGHGTDFTPCERVPEDEVYYKTTSTDAGRLILYPLPWPEEITDEALWQNLAAWSVFNREALGKPLPWLDHGVPLALIGFDVSLAPKWIDRHAVVRPAGKPRQRVLIQPTFDARTWPARFDQFCAQLSGLTSPRPAAELFQFVPPIGLLPRAYLAMTKRAASGTNPPAWLLTQRFFPKGYTVDVSVVPLEQLDALLADTVRLQPYDFGHLDAVRLLLPVSQQWFDPQLLQIEVIDPRFDQHIAQYRQTRGDWLAKRYDLGQRRRALELSAGLTPTPYPLSNNDPDPKRLESPENPVSAPSGEALQYGVTRSGTGTALSYASQVLADLRTQAASFLKRFTDEDIEEFKQLFRACGINPEQIKAAFAPKDPPKWLANFSADGSDPTLTEPERIELRRELLAYIKKQTEVQETEQAKVGSANLQELITYFEQNTNEADELVDAGFLKMRTDVFRLGTLLSNNSLTTKFVASPSLANIVDRKPPKADAAGVSAFASQLLANFSPSAAGAATTEESAAVASTPETLNVAMRAMSTTAAATTNLRLSGSVSANALLKSLSDTGRNITEKKQLLDSVADKLSADELTAFNQLRRSTEALTSTETLGQIKGIADVGKFADTFVPSFNLLSQKQLRAIPLQRLQPPLAPAIRNEIHDGRLEIFQRLTRLDISLGDLTTDFVDAPGAPVRPIAPNVITRIRFQTLISHRRLETLATIKTTAGAAADVNDADESKHFASGVSYADMAMAALRAVETRIKDYRAFIERCRTALSQTQAFIRNISISLTPVEVELDESRQDVAVALALKAEEQARLDRINAHREKVLAEHVEFLVFHRPRAIEPRTAVPARAIEPALQVEPVVECLRENPTPPADLAALRDIFRASPAKWFRHAPKWIEKVDRWEHLRDLLDRASRTKIATLEQPPAISVGRYSQTLQKVFQARQVSAQKFLAAPAINASALVALSWLDLRREAERQLTLGHLISAGPPPLAKIASGELEDIFAVATCLHENFSAVPGLIRLEWAERFGQFDNVAVDFRDMSRLPGWSRIEFTLRREMQIHADWLFGRIDTAQPDALDLINDLIRVALLLASHAPVDQLIVGHPVDTEVTPRPGLLLNLRVDPLRIRLGMTVTYKASETQMMRAVVEDISATQVAARVVEAPTVNGQLIKLTPASTLYFKAAT